LKDDSIGRVHQIEENLKDMAELKNILSSIGKVEGIIGHCPPNAGETGLRRSKGIYVGN
jgi:hypothetical protein